MNVLTRNWRPLLFIVLGLSAVLAAHYLLDVCGDHGHFLEMGTKQIPMRCHWSERAFQGLGGLVAVLGVAMLFSKNFVRGLSLAAAGVGGLMIATVLWLVPTCGTATMVCNLSFKPGALTFAGVIILAGLIGSLELRRLDSAGVR